MIKKYFTLLRKNKFPNYDIKKWREIIMWLQEKGSLPSTKRKMI